MNRKKWMRVLVTGVALLLLSGCRKQGEGNGEAPSSEVSATPQITAGASVGNAEKEAGMLQILVNSGKLPALEKRIPEKADVLVELSGSVGVYGESAQLAAIKADSITGELLSEGLFRYDAEGNITPNIAKSYEVNGTFTEYTIYLRKGMRWSDGVPFTSDDCIFFYEQLCVPKVFGEDLWSCFTTNGGERAAFKKLDDTSFRVTFAEAKPSFLNELLEQGGICFAPEHYFVNLLPEYMGEDAALAKAKDMGYEGIEEMLRATVTQAWNVVGIPTLNPYCLSGETGKNDVTGNYYEFVRNPYYWKADAEGKQLPYLDKLEFVRVSDSSQKLLLATEGYLTVSSLMVEQVEKAQENAERGDYHLVAWNNFTYWIVKNRLNNFPETRPLETKVRGVGAAHVECWYFE